MWLADECTESKRGPHPRRLQVHAAALRPAAQPPGCEDSTPFDRWAQEGLAPCCMLTNCGPD